MSENKNLKNKVISLRNEGFKMTEIVVKLNCSLSTVKYHCSKNGLAGKSKISEDNFDIMKKMINDGVTQKEISEKLKISISTIKRYKDKSFEELNKYRGYMLSFMKDRRKDIKKQAVEYMGGSCKLCGYNKCFTALSFHHIDPETKDFQISGTNRCWEKIKKELDKCVMLCTNCHLEVHDGITKI